MKRCSIVELGKQRIVQTPDGLIYKVTKAHYPYLAYRCWEEVSHSSKTPLMRMVG